MNINMKITTENEYEIRINNWTWKLYHLLSSTFLRNQGTDEEIIKLSINKIVNLYIDYLEGRFIILSEYEDCDNQWFEEFHQVNMELSNKESVKKMIQEFLESNKYILNGILLELQYDKKIELGISRVETEEEVSEESKEYIDELSLEDLEEVEEIVED